ncbi:hypothetical protein KR074_004029 [Drosophila pseudoananassae]|nr:hypothetical protein KR074_004029 [Drosophila pseudoananassae]
MNTKLCIVLLAIGLTQAIAVPAPALQFAYPETNFIQYLQARDLTSDPSHSVACMNYYIPQLNDVANQFKANFQACLDEANLELEAIDDKTSANRTQINESATDSCQLLQSCSTIETSIDFFSCYSSAGSESARNMYTISADASELEAYVVEQIRLIDVNKYVCTNNSERAYVQDTAAVYDKLNLCIEGGPLPSETTASPEPTVPTESTTAPPESTAAPAESTAAPAESTAAPAESTAAPAESTAAPAESTAAPAESTAAPAESTAAPAESTAAPAESTAAPAESTAAPAESTAAPAESTAAPAESTAAPAESTAAPAESTAAPGDQEKAPEEDLSEFSGVQLGESQNLQKIIQNLQNWLKNRV